MKKKNLSKILREHNQAKVTLQIPLPEETGRYGDAREYLIGSPIKMRMGNGTFEKQELQRKLKSLKSWNEFKEGLTPEQVSEKLNNRIYERDLKATPF